MDLKQFTLLIGVASLPSLATATTVYRTISKVAAVTVDCPEGTAPRLPNLVWVTYSDGYSEYRQVRWANAPLADEHTPAWLAARAIISAIRSVLPYIVP